jgi:hypothetical protein
MVRYRPSGQGSDAQAPISAVSITEKPPMAASRIVDPGEISAEVIQLQLKAPLFRYRFMPVILGIFSFGL